MLLFLFSVSGFMVFPGPHKDNFFVFLLGGRNQDQGNADVTSPGGETVGIRCSFGILEHNTAAGSHTHNTAARKVPNSPGHALKDLQMS